MADRIKLFPLTFAQQDLITTAIGVCPKAILDEESAGRIWLAFFEVADLNDDETTDFLRLLHRFAFMGDTKGLRGFSKDA